MLPEQQAAIPGRSMMSEVFSDAHPTVEGYLAFQAAREITRSFAATAAGYASLGGQRQGYPFLPSDLIGVILPDNESDCWLI
jgi:hypothetical protein